jgi:hypothetical protein
MARFSILFNVENKKLFPLLIIAQSSYIFVTAIWPIIDIESFMYVTGPKTDIWLVKTVGALLIPVSLSMVSHFRTNGEKFPALILGAGTASAFICVDLYYALSDVISDIYLIDAALEVFFLCLWIYLGLSGKTDSHKK